jgi:hypothetical protein
MAYPATTTDAPTGRAPAPVHPPPADSELRYLLLAAQRE